MGEMDLIEWGKNRVPYQRHSETSRAAAESLEPEKLNRLQAEILDVLKAWPTGLTDEEIQRFLKMNPSTQRPRRIELFRKGLIYQADEKRKTSSGRKAAVWIAK